MQEERECRGASSAVPPKINTKTTQPARVRAASSAAGRGKPGRLAKARARVNGDTRQSARHPAVLTTALSGGNGARTTQSACRGGNRRGAGTASAGGAVPALG